MARPGKPRERMTWRELQLSRKEKKRKVAEGKAAERRPSKRRRVEQHPGHGDVAAARDRLKAYLDAHPGVGVKKAKRRLGIIHRKPPSKKGKKGRSTI